MCKPVYLYVTPFFPSPNSWRGVYCFDFVRALRRELELRVGGGEWKVLVFVPGLGEDYEIDGVKVYRFPTKQLPSNILPFLFRRYNERSFLNKLREVLNSTIDLHLQPTPTTAPQVAVVHAHTANCSIYALAAKREFGCQALLHHHDLQSFGLNLGVLRHCALYNAVLFRQMRKLFEQIDTHVFISEKSRESFLKAPDASWTIYDDYKHQMRGPVFFHCRHVRIKRSIILHNGVDTAIFNREVKAQGEGEVFTIGCIGNFVDLKDQATLIRAVGLLKEPVKVVFVGSGPTLDMCKRLANSIVQPSTSNLQPQFEFRTEVPHEQLADFYHSLDLFVVPSYFEGFGCVFTEAWSCGVPFMACKGSPMEEVVRDDEKDMWLFKEKDADDLCAHMKRFYEQRPAQHIKCAVDIDVLVANFVKQLGCMS